MHRTEKIIYIFVYTYTGCSKKHVTILNGYNFFNIHSRYMKQKSSESRDFKILLHLSIYFSNIFPEATIQFQMQRLNSSMTLAEFQQELIR